MKRFLSLGLILLLMLSAAGCGSSDADEITLQNVGAPATEETTDAPSQSSDDNSTETSEPEDSDSRGIPGMSAFPAQMVLSEPPFNVPIGEQVVSADTEYCAFSCISYGDGSDPYEGVSYDYSLSLDDDNEIVSATFGVTSTGASEETLLLAADLYFYCVGQLNYDTADRDTLCAWFEEGLKTVGSDGMTTTVGDATYSLYGTPGSMYWVDISKTAS